MVWITMHVNNLSKREDGQILWKRSAHSESGLVKQSFDFFNFTKVLDFASALLKKNTEIFKKRKQIFLTHFWTKIGHCATDQHERWQMQSESV